MASSSEADARIAVDQRLREAGWDLANKLQVRTEVTISDLGPAAMREAGGDYLGSPPIPAKGRADYVLCDQRGRALAVIEAKRQAFEPYQAKQQALPYAQAIGAPFIFLSNGELIYFWDYQNDDARVVDSFFIPAGFGAAGGNAIAPPAPGDHRNSRLLSQPGRNP